MARITEKTRRLNLHGEEIAYRTAGEGPALLLIHGITSDSNVWERVTPGLARKCTVIAPDLAGHGESHRGRGDYSLGAHATTLRDLLMTLGDTRVTVVGHSLGGGVAMQFAYQFPEMCERLVLVDSGGLGQEVSFLLRAATLPGSELVLPLLAASRLLAAGAKVGGTLADGESRAAFLHTLRSVVDYGGQRVNASNRLYLAQHMPILMIWGEHDSIIPASHGHAAHEALPGSELVVLSRSGHFPQLDEPECFLDAVLDFIEGTEPAADAMALWCGRVSAGTGA